MNENQFLTNKIEKPRPNFYEQINQELETIGWQLDEYEADFSTYQGSIQKIEKVIWDFFDSGRDNDQQFLPKKLHVCSKLMEFQLEYERIIEDRRERGEVEEFYKNYQQAIPFKNLALYAGGQLKNIFSTIIHNNESKKIDFKKYIAETSPAQLMELLISCGFVLNGEFVDGIEAGKSFLGQYQKEIVRQINKPEFKQTRTFLQRKLREIQSYGNSRDLRFILAKMRDIEGNNSRDNAEAKLENWKKEKIFLPNYVNNFDSEQIKFISGYDVEKYIRNLNKGESFFDCLTGIDNLNKSLMEREDSLVGIVTGLGEDLPITTEDYHQAEKDYAYIGGLQKEIKKVVGGYLIGFSFNDQFEHSLIIKNGKIIADTIANLINNVFQRSVSINEENREAILALKNLANSPKICKLLNRYLDEKTKKIIYETLDIMLNHNTASMKDFLEASEFLDKTKGKLKILPQSLEISQERLGTNLANLLAEARGYDKKDEKGERIKKRIAVADLKPEEIKGERVLRQILGKYGLDVDKTISAWETVTEKSIPYGPNLKAIIKLEKEKPGITKYLQENFNIVHFGRYPEELLIAQYEEQKLQREKNPYVVIINPYSDWNGAFGQNYSGWQKLYWQLKGKHLSLKVVEADDKKDIAELLLFLYKSFGRAIGGFIGGHGSKDSIDFGSTWGKYDAKHFLHTNDLTVSIKGLVKNFFEDNSTLVLNSCSTGESGGIAEELSKIGLKVIGPDRPTGFSRITPIYDQEKGRLDLQVIYSTRINPFLDRDQISKSTIARPEKVYHLGKIFKSPRPQTRVHFSKQGKGNYE